MSLDKDMTAKSSELQALERLLESHGSNRTRWPAPERLRFAGLISASPEARRMLAEAAALDRLLDLAATSEEQASDGAGEAALAARISSAARHVPQDEAAAAVTRLSVRAKRTDARPTVARWPAAALMAACLAAGIFIGSSRWLEAELAPLTGIFEGAGGLEDEFGSEQASLWPDEEAPLEEEML